ncbi:MAG: hypothetical protein OHK0023_06630 [Anaerolineae bacterium]
MKKAFTGYIGVSVLLLAVMFGLSTTLPTYAQGNTPTSVPDILPPAIVSFTADARSITVEAMEAGTAQINLTWATVGLTAQYRLQLFALQAGDWVLVTDQEFPPAGTARLNVSSAADFTPPTYRMAIFNRQNQLFSQAILSLPFDTSPPALPPAIVAFQTINPTLDFVELAQSGGARIGVRWQVRSRTPSSNLVFEQILPDGRAIPVELPRLVRWIPSSGEGVVAPILPDNNAIAITLRLRLIDYAQGAGAVLAESTISVPISRGGQTGLVTPTLLPAPPPVIVASPTP